MESGTSFLQSFDVEWQRKLVRVILNDWTFADSIHEVLDLNYFSNEAFRILLRSFYHYKETYKKFPTLDLLIATVNEDSKKLGRTQWEQLKEIIISFKMDGPVDEAEFIKASSVGFCKKKQMANALLQASSMLAAEDGDEVYDKVVKMFTKIANSGILNEAGHAFVEDFEARYQETFRFPVTTGLPPLDEICGGGLGKKEFGVVIGGTGSGKSMVLSYMAAMAMAAGYNVFYYTLELSDIVVGRRIDACLTGISQEGLMSRRDEVFERISQFPGKILIKEFPGGHRTLLSKVVNHTKKEIKSGNKPDVIFLDYADLLKTTANFSEKRINLEELFDELRGTAQELDVALWTVSQTNRGGYQTEQVDLNDISESFGKTFCADLVVTIARTLEQKELDLATFQIAKNRNGRDGLIFDGILDTSKVYVEFKQRKAFQDPDEALRKNIRDSYGKSQGKKNNSPGDRR